MKKLFLSFLLIFLPMLASAETVEINGIWYNIITNDNIATVTSNPNGDQYFGNVYIPEEITYNEKQYPITKIGEYAFYACNNLTSIDIPNSVTTIGDFAFKDCTNLTSITIPGSITNIGRDAFAGRNTINQLKYSIYIKDIEAWCNIKFNGNNSNPLSFSHHLYINGKEIKELVIPNSVNTIGSYSFYRCNALRSVIIPNSVTSIDECAFYGCSNLASVTIGSGVTSIKGYSFGNCDDLYEVYCLAENVPVTDNVFPGSYPIVLHVPATSIDAYRSVMPWNIFKTIEALEDDSKPETPKCATPEISYADGKISLSCETEGVEFTSEVTVSDAKKYTDSDFTLSQKYTVSVYATKAGYENSDVVTREIVIGNGQSILFGDLNKDGKVNVADHVKLSEIIMNK